MIAPDPGQLASEARIQHDLMRARIYGSSLAKVLERVASGEYDDSLDLIRATVNDRIEQLREIGEREQPDCNRPLSPDQPMMF